MIQRKQTLWLLLATVAAFLTLKFSFYTGNVLELKNIKTYKTLDARFDILILIVTVAIAVISLVTIFLYNDRKKQLLLCTTNCLLSITVIVLYFLQIKKFVDGAISITSLITLVIPVLIMLAIVGIYRDEKLIKSVDRLR